MHHLIIGCGYLGRRIARMWIERGETVHATTRSIETAARFRDEGIEPIVCDVQHPRMMSDLPPFDTVVHAVGWDRSSGVPMREIYVESLKRVLSSLAAPRKWIHVSSTSVYGQLDESWVDEESETEPREESGRIVLEAEQVVRGRLPNAIVLRFAGIYGPGRLLRQKSIQAGETIVADPEKWLNLIHVEDGARAVLAAEANAPPGLVCNISDGQPVKRRDFYGELAQLLDAPPPRYDPPRPGTPTPPHELANRRLDNRRMREVLRSTPTFMSYREGLRASIGNPH